MTDADIENARGLAHADSGLDQRGFRVPTRAREDRLASFLRSALDEIVLLREQSRLASEAVHRAQDRRNEMREERDAAIAAARADDGKPIPDPGIRIGAEVVFALERIGTGPWDRGTLIGYSPGAELPFMVAPHGRPPVGVPWICYVVAK